MRELQVQTEEQETAALKWGDKMVSKDRKHNITASQVSKLCERAHEVELELEVERRRLTDASKAFRKATRGGAEFGVEDDIPGINEYAVRATETRKNGERMSSLVDRLQQQVQG